MSFKVIYYTNPFRGSKTYSQEYRVRKGKALSEYIGGLVGDTIDLIVFKNGELVDADVKTILPENQQLYAVVPVPKGNWKRDDWKFMFNLSMFAGGLFLPGLWAKVALGVGTIGNAFWPSAPMKKLPSASYSWEHTANNTASHNTPMSILFGKARVKPIVKNRFITTEDGKQYLHILYSLCGHKIDELALPEWAANTGYYRGDIVKSATYPGMSFECVSSHVSPINNLLSTSYWKVGHGTAKITEADIHINGNPITKYMSDGKLVYETRPGLATQTVISGFDATYTNYTQDDNINRIVFPVLAGTNSGVDGDGNAYPAGTFLHSQSIPVQLHYLYYEEDYYKVLYYGVTGQSIYWSPTSPEVFESNSGGDRIEVAHHIGSVWNLNEDDRIPTTNEWLTIPTYSPTTQDLQLDFYFPSGLYGLNAKGESIEAYCYLFAQYKRVRDENGNTVTDTWHNDLYLTSAQKYVWAPTLTDTDGQKYKQFRFRSKTTQPFYISLKYRTANDTAATLTKGEYTVRVCALSPTPLHIINVAAITYGEGEGFSCPGEALLGIRALASGQLNGDIETTVVIERSIVQAYTGTAWVDKPANNHAWAIYDIFVNGSTGHPGNDYNDVANLITSYGCGFSQARIDYTSFSLWADYITSLGYELNIVFDSFMTRWDAILRICLEGRGKVSPIGNTVYAIIDKPTTYSQLICVGNTAMDSYSEAWSNPADRPNLLEITYFDKERDYDQTTFTVRGSTWDLDSRSDPEQITFYGTTDFNQAYELGRLLLNCNEQLSMMATLKRDIDSLSSEIGDVVRIQQDIPQWGYGGRLVKAENNLLNNPSFELGTGGVDLFIFTYWGAWGDCPRNRDATQHVSGSYSYYHYATGVNQGVWQAATVEPSTQYTLSGWIWVVANTNLRILTYANGVYKQAVPTTSGAWEKVSVTFTTGAAETSIPVWVGGIGEAYFDAIQLELGAVATDFMWGARLTLDKSVTMVAGQNYKVMVTPKTTGIPIEKTCIVDAGTTTELRLLDKYTDEPEQYDPWAFGISTSYYKEFRVIDIDRSDAMYRTAVMQEYKEGVYTLGTIPTITLPDKNVFNEATNIQLFEVLSQRSTGEYKSDIVATWEQEDGDAFGMWDVMYRDVDVSDNGWRGEWDSTISYDRLDLVYNEDNVYLSMVSSNDVEPFYEVV